MCCFKLLQDFPQFLLSKHVLSKPLSSRAWPQHIPTIPKKSNGYSDHATMQNSELRAMDGYGVLTACPN